MLYNGQPKSLKPKNIWKMNPWHKAGAIVQGYSIKDQGFKFEP